MIGVRVVRVTPNTPALVGTGVSAYTLGMNCDNSVDSLMKMLLSCIGICEEVPERLQDSVTGLSGSGPAYVRTLPVLAQDLLIVHLLLKHWYFTPLGLVNKSCGYLIVNSS